MSKNLDKHLNSGNLRKAIWEHLKTRKKYNTLMIKYETAIQDRRNAEADYEIKKNIFEIREREWKKALEKQEQEIIELRKRKVKKDVANNKKSK